MHPGKFDISCRVKRFLLSLAALLALTGCNRGKPTVILYADQERHVVEPLVAAFQQEKHIPVEVVYADAKAMQSGQGLSDRIREEGGKQADLYWASGPSAIEKVQGDGLLAPALLPEFKEISDSFSEDQANWAGVGARVRVLLYNKNTVPPARVPKSIGCLTQSAWKGRAALADPRLSASSNYHLLTVFTALKEMETTHFLEQVKANDVQLLPDEAGVVEAVASGKADWGVTDSDLAMEAVNARKPVDYVVADQELYSTADAFGKVHGAIPTLGTPALPAPLAMLRDRPHRAEGRVFYEWLISAQAALQLATLQPTRLPTHQFILNKPGERRRGKIADPARLNFAPVLENALNAARPQLALALAKTLGDSPR